MKLSREDLNRLRVLILEDLGRAPIAYSEEEPVAVCTTWGDHPATGVYYAGTVMISDDEDFSKDFFEEFRVWLQIKGISVTDLI